MVTVSELLDYDFFNNVDVLTDDVQLLDSPVNSVVMSEVPDIETFVQPGVLVITTAMVYRDKPEELLKLIRSLKRVRSVGLGFKVGRFFDEVPEEVIRYANELNFTILEIPQDMFLVDFVHEALNIIQGTDDLAFSLELQKQISALIFKEASLQTILDRLAAFLGTSLLLVSPYYSYITVSRNGDFDGTTDYIQRIIEAVRDNHIVREVSLGIHVEDIEDKEQYIQVKVLPLSSYQYRNHYLVFLHPEKLSPLISAFTFEQVAVSMSFAIYKERKESETKYAIESEYYRRLLNVDEVLGAKIDKHNLKYGVKNSDFYQVIRLEDRHKDRYEKQPLIYHERLELLSEWFREYRHKYFEDALIYEDIGLGGVYIILQSYVKKLNSLLNNIAGCVQRDLSIEIYFSLGNPYTYISQLSLSYNEANIVYDAVNKHQDFQTVNYLDSNGFYHLFGKVDADSIRYYCQAVLKDLAYPEKEQMIELRNTLKTYLDYQCEISTTAKQLFVHRNTVIYRILKCEEMLGYEVNTPKSSLNLRLAIELSS